MPSRFDPLAPRDGTAKANDNYREDVAVPPRDAPESTNTYEFTVSVPAFCKPAYNEPAGQYAVYKSLARWAACGLTYGDYKYTRHPSAKNPVNPKYASVYETTHLYTGMTELDSG
eukprot:5355270-Pleurochrysis_carterae.AAC.6